jgi:hypothetical protein
VTSSQRKFAPQAIGRTGTDQQLVLSPPHRPAIVRIENGEVVRTQRELRAGDEVAQLYLRRTDVRDANPHGDSGFAADPRGQLER